MMTDKPRLSETIPNEMIFNAAGGPPVQTFLKKAGKQDS
jgi:hypothetical protein